MSVDQSGYAIYLRRYLVVAETYDDGIFVRGPSQENKSRWSGV